MSLEQPENLVDSAVNIVLRYRRICRQSPLSGIHAVIYEKVQQQLFSEVASDLDRKNSQSIRQILIKSTSAQSLTKVEQKQLADWAAEQRDKAFMVILSANTSLIDGLAVEAQKLAAEAKKFQTGREQWKSAMQPFRLAMGELYEALRLSGKLAHPHQGKFPREVYEQIYEDAFNEAWAYFCQKLEKYNSQYPFTAWFNSCLEKRVLDSHGHLNDPYLRKLIASIKKKKSRIKKILNWWLSANMKTQLSKSSFNGCLPISTLLLFRLHTITNPPVRDLDPPKDLEQPKPRHTRFEECIDFVRDDPGDRFKKAYTSNNPRANFQAIFLRKNAEGKTWKEIAKEFNVEQRTIAQFYQRCLEKKFRQDFENFFS
jgi:DNA-directed RNA polymerase specialized sigma24 family protein